ncbi:alpha/beta hydrolase [Aporhodopirellula aestuarii]|uniref:Alpha/beta fold hydrolase n=1 Tax=Aporhodopirellula aestuarii TaxID=2950107 RepID=A0ABT0UB46_9BACT|nr:alpha/beta fold hydrolase [Aporhodopirellula aestuarii]MCM2374101.1 alpha/beta fold hydrolase [Aporhodopirellula aestuarii]
MDWRINQMWLAGAVIVLVGGCTRAPAPMAENSSSAHEIELPSEFSTPHQFGESNSLTIDQPPTVEEPPAAENSPPAEALPQQHPSLRPDVEVGPVSPRQVTNSGYDSSFQSDSTPDIASDPKRESNPYHKKSRGPYSSKSSESLGWALPSEQSHPQAVSREPAASHTAAATSAPDISNNGVGYGSMDNVATGSANKMISGETARIEMAFEEAAAGEMAMDQLGPAGMAADEAELATGASVSNEDDLPFQSINVLYATDRKQDTRPLAAYQLTGQRQLVSLLGIGVAVTAALSLLAWLLRRPATAKLSAGLTCVMSAAAAGVFFTGAATIEKHGVTYTGDRGQLVRGVCRVTIPKTHTRGTVERPSLLKFEVSENQSKHVVLTSVDELDGDAFTRRMSEELEAAEQPDLMVFIHGYNVDFESAVLRTAQIAVDLPFRGVPVCYSWPSQGTLLGYPVDENNAAWTVGHLKEFLNELVDESGAKSIHVVAHSMGNRAMTAAMQQMSLSRQDDEPIFDRVVLAAPDVDADLFRKDLAGALTEVAEQVTLYASSDDQALVASKAVHGYPRAGETGEFLVVVPGVDTIDVSGIDLSLLGHSYYGDSEPILRDLYEVLLSRLPAYKRSSLISKDYQSQVYWQLAHGGTLASGVTQ